MQLNESNQSVGSGPVVDESPHRKDSLIKVAVSSEHGNSFVYMRRPLHKSKDQMELIESIKEEDLEVVTVSSKSSGSEGHASPNFRDRAKKGSETFANMAQIQSQNFSKESFKPKTASLASQDDMQFANAHMSGVSGYMNSNGSR